MIKYFAASQFTILIQIILCCVFLSFWVSHYKRTKGLILLPVYCMCSLIQTLIGVYYNVNGDAKTIDNILETSINIFTLLEFILLSLFIRKYIVSKRLRKVHLFISLAFILFCCVHWSLNDMFNKPSALLNLVESICLMVACLAYFYDGFGSAVNDLFNHKPEFYVIVGIMIVFSILGPISIHLNEIFHSYRLMYRFFYALNSVAYTILFSFFIIAVRCQINTTQLP